jgi:hypothetical protein
MISFVREETSLERINATPQEIATVHPTNQNWASTLPTAIPKNIGRIAASPSGVEKKARPKGNPGKATAPKTRKFSLTSQILGPA